MMEDFMQQHHDRIRTMIRIEDGQSVTDIYKDGFVIKTEPTHPSQIRNRTENCLWSKAKEIAELRAREKADRKEANLAAWQEKMSKLLKAD